MPARNIPTIIATIAVARTPLLHNNPAAREAIRNQLSLALASIFGDLMRLDHDDLMDHIASTEETLSVVTHQLHQKGSTT